MPTKVTWVVIRFGIDFVMFQLILLPSSVVDVKICLDLPEGISNHLKIPTPRNMVYQLEIAINHHVT